MTVRYFIPVGGLNLPGPWEVGPVELMPLDEASSRFGELNADSPFAKVWADGIEEMRANAVAAVDADDSKTAIDLVTQALAVLRVFQHVRYWEAELTQFGLVGDVGRGVIPYIRSEGDKAAYSFTRRGSVVGFHFNADADADWQDAEVFRWVGGAIGAENPSEGRQRALVGVQLLSQALLERRSTFRMVEVVTALEALLLPRVPDRQTFRLARHVAFFGCGLPDDLCGRARETCYYVSLDPGVPTELKLLQRLRAAGAARPWRCSEWHNVVDWYDLRADVVHGRGGDVTPKAADTALYWTVRRLLEPILGWLKEREASPIESLSEALKALPPSPDWQARLGKLT